MIFTLHSLNHRTNKPIINYYPKFWIVCPQLSSQNHVTLLWCLSLNDINWSPKRCGQWAVPKLGNVKIIIALALVCG